MFLSNDGSYGGIILFVIGFLLIACIVAFFWKLYLNNKARKKAKIFSRYVELRKGMIKKEVMNIFYGLKPKKNKRYFLSYAYSFRTSWFLSNTSVDEGELLEIYFDKKTGKLYDIKLYDTRKKVTTTTRYY